jgi:hypothetical protein
VDLRINDLHGQDARQLDERLNVLAINPGSRPLSGNLDPSTYSCTRIRSPKDSQRGLTMTNQTIAAPGSKGSSATQEKNGFQDGRLAGTVAAGNEAEVGGKI